MNFYVPEIGDRIKLSENWSFDLHYERRNVGLFKAYGIETTGYYHNSVKPEPRLTTMPKGTVLRIDRIYIRKGQGYSEYSSISFVVAESSDKKIVKKRFWAKLADCNTIECTKYLVADGAPVSVYWMIPGNRRTLGEGIIINDHREWDRSYGWYNRAHDYGTVFGFAESIKGEKLFKVEHIRETRPATEDEITAFNEENIKKRDAHIAERQSHFVGKIAQGIADKINPPALYKELTIVTYNKYHLTHIPSGKLIGKYTAIPSIKDRVRKLMKKAAGKDLFTV